MTETATTIIAVDPGRSKSGIAVVSGPSPLQVLQHSVVESTALADAVRAALQTYPTTANIIMGNGTGSSASEVVVRREFPAINLILVDEHGTSERARARFIERESLPVWQRLLPRGLRTPDRPYDDYVAIILAERYFQKPA